jgi:hypothetical protein
MSEVVPNHRLVVNRSATDTQVDVLCICGDEVSLAAYVPLRDEGLAPKVCDGCGRRYLIRTHLLMEEPRAQPQ